MEIKMFCTDCGSELTVDTIKTPIPSVLIPIKVDPCQHCLEDKRKEGWDEGHEAGYSEGLVVENNNDLYRN